MTPEEIKKRWLDLITKPLTNTFEPSKEDFYFLFRLVKAQTKLLVAKDAFILWCSACGERGVGENPSHQVIGSLAKEALALKLEVKE